MASIKEIATSKRDVYMVHPSEIHEKDGWNVRDETAEYLEHIDNLALSIAEIGVREPLKCYMENDVLYVSNGHSRLRAVAHAEKTFGIEIKAIPVLLEDRLSNDADRVLTLLTSNSGLPLTRMEKSRVYKRLLDFGWSIKEIANRSGVSISTVASSLEINTLPEAAKELVREGKVSASFALETVKEGRLEKLEEAAKETGKKVTRQRLDGVERAKRGSKTTLKAVFGEVMKTAEENDENELIHVTMTSDQYNTILRLLDL